MLFARAKYKALRTRDDFVGGLNREQQDPHRQISALRLLMYWTDLAYDKGIFPRSELTGARMSFDASALAPYSATRLSYLGHDRQSFSYHDGLETLADGTPSINYERKNLTLEFHADNWLRRAWRAGTLVSIVVTYLDYVVKLLRWWADVGLTSSRDLPMVLLLLENTDLEHSHLPQPFQLNSTNRSEDWRIICHRTENTLRFPSASRNRSLQCTLT